VPWIVFKLPSELTIRGLVSQNLSITEFVFTIVAEEGFRLGQKSSTTRRDTSYVLYFVSVKRKTRALQTGANILCFRSFVK
jgi:hypothetical protein